jgi:predicted esterase
MVGTCPFQFSGFLENMIFQHHETKSKKLVINRKIDLMISKLLKLLLFFSLFSGCGNEYGFIEPCTTTSVEIHFRELTGNTKSINCLYSVPVNYNPEKAWPLIITLHGDGSNAVAFHYLWKPVTDSAGFVLLTPQGENFTPDIFNGIAPLGAPFRTEFLTNPGSNLPSQNMLNDFPVYIGHGALEHNFDSEAKLAESLLKKLGCRVKLAPYKGVGHGLPNPMEDELVRILNFLTLAP